jgi:hypothetical protein
MVFAMISLMDGMPSGIAVLLVTAFEGLNAERVTPVSAAECGSRAVVMVVTGV